MSLIPFDWVPLDVQLVCILLIGVTFYFMHDDDDPRI